MPKVGLYRRSLVKKVRPSVRLTVGATAQNFGAGNAAGLLQGGKSMQNAGASMMQDINREKRIEVAEQKQAEREAKAEAKAAANDLAITTGRDASNAFQDELRELEREYSQLKGRDAVGTYKTYSEKIKGLYGKHIQNLTDKERKAFDYNTGRRFNTSLDALSKFDLSAQKNYEMQTLTESITGNTNDLINNRYDSERIELALDQISNDSHEIGLRQGMTEEGIKNLMRTNLQAAHLQTIEAMMKDGEFDKASDYLHQHGGEFYPGVFAEKNKEIDDKGRQAKAPILSKQILQKHPNDIAAQNKAVDLIKDPKVRELVRKETLFQNQILKAKLEEEKKVRFQGMLSASLLHEDGSIATTWKGKLVDAEEIDKVRKARDKIVANKSGNIDYYYDVKEQIELGRIKNIDFTTVELEKLTSEQIKDLFKVKDEKENGSGSSSGQKYVATFNEQAKTGIKAAGIKIDEIEGSMILSKARKIFEREKVTKGHDLDYFERQKIIDECIGDETPGEEGEGFINENMTLGEAKKRNLGDVFEADRPDNIVNGSSWNNEIGAYVRPDNSEFGATIQDGHGRDITPVNLEPETKWNQKINRFIKTTDKTRKVFDTSGALVFEIPIEAKYTDKYFAFTKSGETDIGNGVMKPCIYVYSLRDGQIYIKVRKD